ncbi:MAG: hypothetical protein ACO2PO_16495 [Candidatus Calescibacterium sp.]
MPKKNTDNEQEIKAQNEANYPRIIGGICEFCGISAKECEHYKDAFYNNQFVCLCGGSRVQSTFNQSIYMYVPEWKAWICNSEGCRRQVELRGGFTKEEILRFYVP